MYRDGTIFHAFVLRDFLSTHTHTHTLTHTLTHAHTILYRDGTIFHARVLSCAAAHRPGAGVHVYFG